jgi:hypothetical protein
MTMSKMDMAITRARDLATEVWPDGLATNVAETVKQHATRLAAIARDYGREVPPPRRSHPLLFAAGGVLFGIGASALMHRLHARTESEPVGTYFSRRDTAPHAGEPKFANEQEAFLAEGAGFEDPTGGEPLNNPLN